MASDDVWPSSPVENYLQPLALGSTGYLNMQLSPEQAKMIADQVAAVTAQTLGCQALYNHREEVVNKTWNFAERLERPQDHFMNAAAGLAAEAGELLDEHKKLFYHTDHGIDSRRAKILSEAGDVIYYWLKLLELHNLTIEEVLAENRAKLESRHPELGKVTERFGPGAKR